MQKALGSMPPESVTSTEVPPGKSKKDKKKKNVPHGPMPSGSMYVQSLPPGSVTSKALPPVAVPKASGSSPHSRVTAKAPPAPRGGKRRRYYVVTRGHKPGVYTDITSAQRQIDGIKQGMFLRFPSRQEAEHYFAGKNYYVVVVGRKLGVYNDLASATRETEGFPGSTIKKFKSLPDAQKCFGNARRKNKQ